MVENRLAERCKFLVFYEELELTGPDEQYVTKRKAVELPTYQ